MLLAVREIAVRPVVAADAGELRDAVLVIGLRGLQQPPPLVAARCAGLGSFAIRAGPESVANLRALAPAGLISAGLGRLDVLQERVEVLQIVGMNARQRE